MNVPGQSGFGGFTPPDFYQWDFHNYARQSSVQNFGNANTGVQKEDLPALVATRFGIDPAKHEFFRTYDVEVVSASDGAIRFASQGGGRLIINDFERSQFIEILETIRDRWRRFRRPSVLAVTMLNRLGRSHITLPLIESYSNECEGNLYIYVGTTGTLLNPQNASDQSVLVAEFSFSGKGENRTKQMSVIGARRRIGTQPAKFTRSLGERPFGYDKVYCDLDGTTLTDEAALEWTKRRSKQPPRALQLNPGYVPIIVRIFDLYVLDRLTPGRIAARIQAEYGDNPQVGRPWSFKMIDHIIRNPIYRGQRITDRTKSLNLGNNKRRRKAREEELVVSPLDETLRVISDETWQAVQEILETQQSLPTVAGKKEATGSPQGRPRKADILFQGAGLLRCGLCGASLVVHHYTSRVYYRCGHRTTLYNQPRCQSHIVTDIDPVVDALLGSLLASVQTFTDELRREIRDLKSQKKTAVGAKQLASACAALSVLDEGLLLMRLDLREGKIRQEDYNRKEQVIAEKREEVERLEQQVKKENPEEIMRQKEAWLCRIESMGPYAHVSMDRKRAYLVELLQDVGIWPDGRLEFQWHGQPEVEVEKNVGRPLQPARDWPLLDFQRLGREAVQLIERSQIPYVMLNDGTVNSTVQRNLAAMAKGDRKQYGWTLAVLRIFARARAYFVAVPRLLEDIKTFGLSKTSYHIERDFGIPKKTWGSLLDGTAYWTTVVRVAKQLGWNLEPYRKLPDGIFDHPKFDEMVYWLLPKRAGRKKNNQTASGIVRGEFSQSTLLSPRL